MASSVIDFLKEVSSPSHVLLLFPFFPLFFLLFLLSLLFLRLFLLLLLFLFSHSHHL